MAISPLLLAILSLSQEKCEKWIINCFSFQVGIWKHLMFRNVYTNMNSTCPIIDEFWKGESYYPYYWLPTVDYRSEIIFIWLLHSYVATASKDLC